MLIIFYGVNARRRGEVAAFAPIADAADRNTLAGLNYSASPNSVIDAATCHPPCRSQIQPHPAMIDGRRQIGHSCEQPAFKPALPARTTRPVQTMPSSTPAREPVLLGRSSASRPSRTTAAACANLATGRHSH